MTVHKALLNSEAHLSLGALGFYAGAAFHVSTINGMIASVVGLSLQVNYSMTTKGLMVVLSAWSAPPKDHRVEFASL